MMTTATARSTCPSGVSCGTISQAVVSSDKPNRVMPAARTIMLQNLRVLEIVVNKSGFRQFDGNGVNDGVEEIGVYSVSLYRKRAANRILHIASNGWS